MRIIKLLCLSAVLAVFAVGSKMELVPTGEFKWLDFHLESDPEINDTIVFYMRGNPVDWNVMMKNKRKEKEILIYDKIQTFRQLLSFISQISKETDGILSENKCLLEFVVKTKWPNRFVWTYSVIERLAELEGKKPEEICESFGGNSQEFLNFQRQYEAKIKNEELSLRKKIMSRRIKHKKLQAFQYPSDDFEIAFFSCFEVAEQIKSAEMGFQDDGGNEVNIEGLISLAIEKLNELFEKYDIESLKKVPPVVECAKSVFEQHKSCDLIIGESFLYELIGETK